MEADSLVLPFYMKQSPHSGSLERNPICIIMHSEESPEVGILASTMSQYFLEKKNRRYIELYTEFLTKWEQQQNYFSVFPKAFVFEKIKEVIDSFLTLNPSYVTFELTSDCSVFFQSLVNGYNIYFELYFTTDLKDGVEAITNIYKDGRTIFAYGGSIDTVFSQIDSKVCQTSYEVESTQSFYGISETAFASTEF
ncbi:MAG TPA: hypothetical protein PLU53_08065 [Bacteroidia bacterium]|nr:hypothetical protein [Bacteroidia bacterium]